MLFDLANRNLTVSCAAFRPTIMPRCFALLACVVPWIGSSCFLLVTLVLLAQAGIGPGASPAEVDFIVGSGTVVGGWRFVCATALPPPE